MRTIDYIADGPFMAVYGLLELYDDGRIEFRSATGEHIWWFQAAVPPEYFCA